MLPPVIAVLLTCVTTLFRARATLYLENLALRHQEEVVIAPRRPWQNPYVERLIGSIRRVLLNHVIVLPEDHLRRLLPVYSTSYLCFRTHLSLAMDCPEPRPVAPLASGTVIEVPEVGGLHHYYERRAA
jgi:hypothetical protein